MRRIDARAPRLEIHVRSPEGSAVDAVVLFPAAAVPLGLVLGAIHGLEMPSPLVESDRLTAALTRGASWSATLGVAGACLGILLAAALILTGRRIARAPMLAGIASVSLFLVLLDIGILLYGRAVGECFAFPQILGVFGILLLAYAIALGAYVVAAFGLRHRPGPPVSPPRREWFLPDASSLN